MTCSRDILRARTILNSNHRLRNHLTRIGAHNMYAQDPIRLLLGKELDLALRVQVGLGTRIGREGELADIILYAVGFELLLGLANPCDLRVGVDDGGDCLVVDVAVAGLDVLDSGDTCSNRS